MVTDLANNGKPGPGSLIDARCKDTKVWPVSSVR